MNIIDVPIWIALASMVLLGSLVGYLDGKCEPSDAATLLVAGRMVDETDRSKYVSPGQLATILLPRPTRLLKVLSLFLKIALIAIAVLTTWWAWIPARLMSSVVKAITEVKFSNWSLDFNCFWIAADLTKRMGDFEKKGDVTRSEAASELLSEFTILWEEIRDNDEIVPNRMEIAKQLGVRRSM